MSGVVTADEAHYEYGWLGEILSTTRCLARVSNPGSLLLEFGILITELPGAPRNLDFIIRFT